MTALAVSHLDETTELPSDWEKRVSAAYLRLLGGTQEDCAKQVGRSRRTLIRWEQEPSWAQAELEARRRWLMDLTAVSRKRVLEAVREHDDTATARWALERTMPELAPPATRVVVTKDEIAARFRRALGIMVDTLTTKGLPTAEVQALAAAMQRAVEEEG